ncbi:unnamed protein product [Linum tenue]|uniref:protein-serine/threonine phosphatase n=1 Tax=Linum tenue TaxID=586396 RepID=A0AAV0IUH8_9ROSI|nr:unnamed protein product [Linum tenue]
MSLAVSNSPVFSPPSSLFLNRATSFNIPNSPANLTPTSHFKSACRSPSPSSCSPSSPHSPSFRLRLQKTAAVGSAPAIPSSSSSPTVSKRKRPARLDIPVSAMGFGAPANPAAAAELAEVEREGDGYSVFCKRGRREAMEDRFSALVGIQGDPKQAFFGVFDGHNGAKAAEFAAANLDKNIFKRLAGEEEETEDGIKQGYLETDSQFLKQEARGGSCCVTALIRKGNLVVSNAGDCRAVVSRGGVAEALTSDHRPSREDERHRIESTGGYVDLVGGTWRIQGSLAVSRGIGDGHLKQWVIAEPETRILRIQPEIEFVILASDGLWDKVSNQEAVDVAKALMESQQPPLMACKKLAELAASRGSSDDISVLIVQLGRYI